MTYPAEATALAGELSDRALVYLTGSHLYGLNTPESDKDYTLIYFDAADDRRVFRQYPEVKHSTGNDHKLYSLRKFASLVAVGNPNIVELAAHGREYRDGTVLMTPPRVVVLRFMDAVRPHLVTRHLLAAYVGHVSQVNSEIAKKGVTPKRLSHAIRLAACGLTLMDRPTIVPHFRYFAEQALAFDIKTGDVSLDDGVEHFNQLYDSLLARYQGDRPELPDNTALREAINDFFVHL